MKIIVAYAFTNPWWPHKG